MLVLLAAGAVLGIRSATRQVAATRRLAEHVDTCLVAPAIAGVPLGVDVVDHDDPFAFTFGLRRPRVAVSRGLVEQLSSHELEAVLVHERYHVRARDPLKLLVARAAARTCFFLPAVGHLVARYVAGRELAADRSSVRAAGRPALAGALFKVSGGPGWAELNMAAAMAGPDLLAVRVDQLEQGAEPALPRVPRLAIGVSAVVLATLTGLVGTVALQGGLSVIASENGADASSDVARALAGGLVCTAGWVWLATVAFRRLTTSRG